MRAHHRAGGCGCVPRRRQEANDMGFYADFIHRQHVERQAWNTAHATALFRGGAQCPCWNHDYESIQHHLFGTVASAMRTARVVRLGGDQARVFLDAPAAEGQDYGKWLRLIYPKLYIHLDPSIPFTNYKGEAEFASRMEIGRAHRAHMLRQLGASAQLALALEDASALRSEYEADPPIKGVLLTEPWIAPAPPGAGGYPPEAERDRVIQVFFLMPLPDFFWNMHTVTIFIMKDGRLILPTFMADDTSGQYVTREAVDFVLGGMPSASISCARDKNADDPVAAVEGLFYRTRERMARWTVHLINYLSSPTVELVEVHPAAKLQKARARSGKPPLPGWYEIKYTKTTVHYSRDRLAPKRFEHSFRYDVRGHFATYRHGRMAGRVIWIPKHQRGLKHSLYKPKVYRAGELNDAEGPRWEGEPTLLHDNKINYLHIGQRG